VAKIVLQPCRKGLPATHYSDTVDNLVPLQRMEPFLANSDLVDLRRIFPARSAAVWGVTPGQNSQSQKKWERMDPGDVALFAKEGRIFSVGTVVRKIHNPKLARELWREDEDGHTWEYMYFLTGVHPVSISYEEFNAAAGYAENNVIQGFNVLSEEKSSAVLATLNLIEQQTPNEKALTEIRTVVVESGEFDPSGEIDGRRRALAAIVRRQGQPEFRKRLIQLYSGRCAICGCDAVQTLEAAHIIPYNGPGTNQLTSLSPRVLLMFSMTASCMRQTPFSKPTN
jgi:HNH endonuclease